MYYRDWPMGDQDIFDLATTRKLVAQGRDLTNTQQHHLLCTQSQLEADLYGQCIFGGVLTVFDYIGAALSLSLDR